MTDNEIIKALECCQYDGVETCRDCPMFYTHEFDNEIDFDCGKYIYGRAADLIKRQQAENEKLKAVSAAELDTIHKLGDDYERTLEGVERLKTTLKIVEREYGEMFAINKKLMAEIERLKGANLTGLDEKTKIYLKFRAELDRICVPEILKVVESIPIEFENKAIGLFCVANCEYWKYIDCIYIQPEHRRKHIGADFVKHWYEKNKDCEIRLHIINNNKPALEFWSSIFHLQAMDGNDIDTLYRVKECKE